jgi:F0F1-type ATP synthase assembly protein I
VFLLNYRRQTNPWILVLVLVVGVVAALTWFNYRYAQQNPGGNDFLVHWMGPALF